MGEDWKGKRFFFPYLRNSLWDFGYGIDTLETACKWTVVPEMIDRIEDGVTNAMKELGLKVMVFTHLSHFYNDGSSIYVTYIFDLSRSYEETFAAWAKLKKAASEVICQLGGTISHQHGVGVDHQAYLEAEKGPLGMETIKSLYQKLDPTGIMNPKASQTSAYL